MAVGVKKRSILIDGRKTSITLEDQYWQVLADIAVKRGTSRPKLINLVAETYDHVGNLSRALRLFALEEARREAPSHVA